MRAELGQVWDAEHSRAPQLSGVQPVARSDTGPHTIGREKKYDFMLSDIFLRLLLANVLRPRQKPSPKARAGAGVNRTPLLQVTTGHVADLLSERARGALPAGPAASGDGTAHKELLKAVRIVRGG